MKKYGIIKACLFCGGEFETRPRFLDYCSQPCKNPHNRVGHTPWNKGKKLTEEQKAKQNREGLKKGWGWNKGKPNPRQRDKWLKDNPNAGGKGNIKKFQNGVFTKSYSKGELGLYKKLCDIFDNVVHQYTVEKYHRVYDIYIPKLNLIVEYDGDYWHKDSLEKDLRDTNKAIKRGYKIFRYWESTVKEKGVDIIVEDIVKLEGKYCRLMEEKQNGLQ